MGSTEVFSGLVQIIIQLKTLKDPGTLAQQVTQGISALLNVSHLVWARMMVTHLLRESAVSTLRCCHRATVNIIAIIKLPP